MHGPAFKGRDAHAREARADRVCFAKNSLCRRYSLRENARRFGLLFGSHGSYAFLHLVTKIDQTKTFCESFDARGETRCLGIEHLVAWKFAQLADIHKILDLFTASA